MATDLRSTHPKKVPSALWTYLSHGRGTLQIIQAHLPCLRNYPHLQDKDFTLVGELRNTKRKPVESASKWIVEL